MALSDEQNAMLRLLARGEQGYADIAALMGLSEQEVRAKVVGALAQLRAEGQPVPDVPSPLPDGKAETAAEPSPPRPEAPAEEPVAAPVAPPRPQAGAADRGSDAREPSAPAGRPAAAPAGRPPSGPRTITLPTGRAAWLWGGGIATAIAVIVIVVIVLTSGGGGGESSSTATGGETAATGATGAKAEAAAAEQPTEAKLKAVDGSDASGRAGFGRVKKTLALQVEATGLAPTTKGTDSYTVWLAASPQRMLPLAFPIEVKASGKGANEIAAQFEVPIEVLAYLADGTFDQIAITRTRDKRLEAALTVAQKKKRAPAYTGEAVLRGTITGPIVGLALREKNAKEEGGK